MPRPHPLALYAGIARLLLGAAVATLLAPAVRAQIVQASPVEFASDSASALDISVSYTLGPLGGYKVEPSSAVLCASLPAGSTPGVQDGNVRCAPGAQVDSVAVISNTSSGMAPSLRAQIGSDQLKNAIATADKLRQPRAAYLLTRYTNGDGSNTARTVVLRIKLLDSGAEPSAGAGVTAVTSGVQSVSASGHAVVQIRYALSANDRALSGLFCHTLGVAVPSSGLSAQAPCEDSSVIGYAPGNNFMALGSSGRETVQIPPSVTQLAYQHARQSGHTEFYFVRQFASGSYAVQRLRLAGQAANQPLTLTRVELAFRESGGRSSVAFVERDGRPSPWAAYIDYQGSGMLRGRWEVVQPADPEPSSLDLTPEAELTLEQRIQQKRYTMLGRFERMATAGQRLVLEGPPPHSLPTAFNGRYLILLRLEAGPDSSNSDPSRDSASGLSAFALPVLSYYVIEKGALITAPNTPLASMQAIEPAPGARLPASDNVRLRWKAQDRATLYRLEIIDTQGALVFAARILTGQLSYQVPTQQLGLGHGELRWRVMALDAQGQVFASSPFNHFFLP